MPTKKNSQKKVLKTFPIIFIIVVLQIGEMAEWLKAVDCKSIGSFRRRFKSYFLFLKQEIKAKYSVVGSVPVLGTGGHGFKSHYFDFLLPAVLI